MPSPPVTAVVLAAGEGTRMKSPRRAKVLHGFAGRSLLGHALAALDAVAPARTLVVVGHRRDEVIAHLAEIAPAATPVVQEEQKGTGHAVQVALAAADTAATARSGEIVLVIPADAPLLSGQTLQRLVSEQANSDSAATMLTALVEDPTGYGRVLRRQDGGARDAVAGVVEHADATATQREIREVAASVYAFDAALLRTALDRLSSDNAQGELYLPDVIGIFSGDGLPVRAVVTVEEETAGVNTRAQLADAHRHYNARLLRRHMEAGVTVIDPATTWVDADVTLEVDVTLRPSVELFGATSIASGASIGPDVSLTDCQVGEETRISRAVAVSARIGARCEIGPFAYLRPGTDLADEVKIGTYVEVKGSDIGTGSKVPHLSYVGDASIGEQTNIGAASVFVNYDGVTKRRSVIGSHARTGADNMFVAPVNVGDGAYTAAGSVITTDVPPGAMAVARARQRNVEGWVARSRAGTDAARAAELAQAQHDQPDSTNSDDHEPT
ncbi:UDP-N-acetylglucosamine pyrophosphorylase /glucosamine-1-phosphate N-acetyltransferase [Jatrophihabitans sp. GAS493]|uniref:bifunctional UDP-N-acetylglucosamine diphosphorylase/glucosamine-1-phosphate N-acetyltransferase GlmU n=1 Tax=Jatrophihabitans sp. GAS493 TaxID=1907575 RepID=UPI000BB6D373|nr:UDP-N-acetylglucosamine pyrophosphorylase /glucosamine-1-phosphate N-acetyltransferase [Jatrophihabitans sp. GAS493]